MRKDNYVYIALYNNKFNENYNNINTYSRRIRLSQINMIK